LLCFALSLQKSNRVSRKYFQLTDNLCTKIDHFEMSFFIRSEKQKRGKPNGVTPAKRKREDYRPRRKENDEVSSESEDEERTNANGHHNDDGEFEDEETAETALEKRHRLTQEYLNRIEKEEKEKHDSQTVDHEAVAHRLKEDAMDQVGRLQRKVADEIIPSDSSTFRVLRGHQLSPTCVSVSHDGQTLVTGSKDGAIIKWDLETGRRLHIIKGINAKAAETERGHHGDVHCLAVSSDNKLLCSGGSDTTIKTWDFRSMDHVKTFTGHRGPVSGLAFRRGHNQLFSCSHDRSLKIWNLDEMGYVDTMYGHQDSILDVDCLTRERAVTCGGRDRTIRIWKVAEESQLVFHAHSGCGSVDCVRLINDDHFVSGSDDGSLAIWSALKKKPVFVLNKAHQEWITSVATHRFTDLLASGSWDGQVKIWRCGEDYRTLTLLHSLKVDGFINALAFTPDATALICAVGQEHRNGRWWRKKEVKNSIVICPLEKRDTV